MRAFGRFLQMLGLILPPLSIVLQLSGSISLGQMLTILLAAVAVFAIGRIVEGYSS